MRALSIIMMCFLMTVASAEAALRVPREVVYRGEIIWVRIAPDQITRLILPSPLTLQPFALSPSVATLSTDPGDTRQLIIHALKPEGTAHVTVNTTRQAYVVAFRQAERAADSVVTVVHPAPSEPKTHPQIDPKAAMRKFWLSQWWGRSLSPSIRVKPVDGFLDQSEDRETQYIAYQSGLGFYGWTLRIRNTGDRPQMVNIEAMQDASGRLVSIIPQRRDSTRELGRLEPGQSMLIHLAYVEGGP